jgi:three-Cys-motif partner protein
MAKQYDEIGIWSELKLSIIRDYATEYSKILSRQSGLRHMYIDGFAGPGVHLSKRTGQFVPGSPLNALEITPPFKEFHFIDADDDRTQQLTALAGGRPDVYAYSGDCNEILPREVFPRASYDRYARALCLLDPYNIDLAWNVVEHAGKMGTIEIFLNFMIMDINMNVLRHDPDSADESQVQRLNRFWGDNSWRQVAYSTTGNLFGYEEKNPNEDLVQAYRERLKKVAGFKYVPDPLPMKTRTGSTIYYLYYAAPESKGGEIGNRIVSHLFDKYRKPRSF